ncbi:phosphoesterase [Fulvitalea axinellae]|uniref:Phosphoesterase n=1 Tax=Fulvitalea axinellae TaxID=1182444 RepID=A0AAU9CLK4_9BACT|nr:phosphoesterase [Fulvitalea axinellae]
MVTKIIFRFLITLVLMIGVDIYFYQAAKVVIDKYFPKFRKPLISGHWGFTVLMYATVALLALSVSGWLDVPRHFFTYPLLIIFGMYLSRLLGSVVVLFDDIRRGVVWLFGKFSGSKTDAKKPDEDEVPIMSGRKISRSEFLSTTALAVAAVPVSAMSFGIISGAHDYRVRRVKVPLKNLPKEFHGIRFAQLSDIHTGSFFNKTAVKGGVEMLLSEKPDAVFFTGDLVNNETKEVNEYFDVFEKVKAPLGVYSTLGNHDYGDYRVWANKKAKEKNLADMHEAHRRLGWNLLLDENRALKVDGKSIGLVGVENWGAGRFAKYGNLQNAIKGTEDYPVKVLLSHDPSHWDHQVLPDSDIDLMFAGHTHGFQFGIEIGAFKWSPAQYRYKQWAGLYEKDNRFLYVNRGFGYLGFPGRVGMPPEITITELVKA